MAGKYSNIKWTKVGLRLLEKAVVIWEDWANYPYESRAECPLCEKYAVLNDSACEGCPIQQFTESFGCEDTPYYEVDYRRHQTIQNEISFLKRLAANGRKVLGVT